MLRVVISYLFCCLLLSKVLFGSYNIVAFFTNLIIYYSEYLFYLNGCSLQVGRWPPCPVLPTLGIGNKYMRLSIKKRWVLEDGARRPPSYLSLPSSDMDNSWINSWIIHRNLCSSKTRV